MRIASEALRWLIQNKDDVFASLYLQKFLYSNNRFRLHNMIGFGDIGCCDDSEMTMGFGT